MEFRTYFTLAFFLILSIHGRAADPLEASCMVNKETARVTVFFTNVTDEPVRVHMDTLSQVRTLSFIGTPEITLSDDDDPVLFGPNMIVDPPQRSTTGHNEKYVKIDRAVSLKKNESIGITFPIWEMAIYSDILRAVLTKDKKGASQDVIRAIEKNVRNVKVECFPICKIANAQGKFEYVKPTDLKNAGTFTLTSSALKQIEKIRKKEGEELPDNRRKFLPLSDPNAGDW